MPNFLTRHYSTAIIILLVLIMAMLLFQVEDTYQIGMLLLAIGITVIHPLPFEKWTFIDIALGGIMLYNIASCFYSSCTIPAAHTAVFSVFCMTAYLTLRRLFDSLHLTRIFLESSYIPIGIALLLAICSFFIFRSSVLGVGFGDTYHLRFLFRPLGYITNIWTEVLLIILGWSCLARHFSVLFCFFTVFAILLSFSRGAYIALLVFLIVWTIAVKPIKIKLKILFTALVAIIIIAIGFPAEMKTTISMNATVSQQRSTEWRINAIGSTWEIVKEHPFFGQGNNSYTLGIDRTQNQDSTQKYTSFAPNLVILQLVEKGLIGILLYLLLAIAICTYLWKYRHITDVCIIGCTLLALFAKEMTQATLTSTPFTYFSVYILLAFIQKKEGENNKSIKIQAEYKSYFIPGIVLLAYLGGIIFNHIQTHNENYCKESFSELNKGNIENAILLMEKTGSQTPYLVQRGILYTECYLKTQIQHYAEKAESALTEAQNNQPKDVQIPFLKAYLYLQKGEINKACPLLTELATCHPKNSLYLYTLGEMYYRNGEKEKALDYWTDAILYTPRLLTISCIMELKQTDTQFYDSLKYKLYTLDTSRLSTPIYWAHYGYIMHWYGNQSTADFYLKKAVEALPNLSTPWHLLGEESKYRLLSLGAFQKGTSSTSIPFETEMTDKRLLHLAYKTKFQMWYGSDLN